MPSNPDRWCPTRTQIEKCLLAYRHRPRRVSDLSEQSSTRESMTAVPWWDLAFSETHQINIIYLERGTSAQMTPFAICFLFPFSFDSDTLF